MLLSSIQYICLKLHYQFIVSWNFQYINCHAFEILLQNSKKGIIKIMFSAYGEQIHRYTVSEETEKQENRQLNHRPLCFDWSQKLNSISGYSRSIKGTMNVRFCWQLFISVSIDTDGDSLTISVVYGIMIAIYLIQNIFHGVLPEDRPQNKH